MFTPKIHSTKLALRDISEQKKNMGYYVKVAIVKDFNYFIYIGWNYSIYIGKKKLYKGGFAWLPDSDTILVGMLKTGDPIEHFIFKEHPTHEEIEKAKQGLWYMEGDTEKTLNIFDYGRFVKNVFKQDSIYKKNSKPRSKWIPRD